MKAVITLTADASGVQAGVAKALQHVEKLQSAVAGIRGLMVANLLQNMAQGFASGALEELRRLQDLGRTFSAEGMMGQNQLQLAQQESNMALGQAFGEISKIIDQATVGHIKELTDYLVANRDSIGQAMAAVAGFGMGLAEITAKTLVAFGNMVDYLSSTSVSQMAADAGMGIATGVGSMVVGASPGMQGLVPVVEMIYDWMRSKLGGD